MAALSHLKNKKESRLREGIDKVNTGGQGFWDWIAFQIMIKCGSSPGESICVKNYFDVLGSYNIQPDKRDVAKINKAAVYYKDYR